MTNVFGFVVHLGYSCKQIMSCYKYIFATPPIFSNQERDQLEEIAWTPAEESSNKQLCYATNILLRCHQSSPTRRVISWIELLDSHRGVAKKTAPYIW